MKNLTLSDDLKWRGQIKDTTFIDLDWINKPRTFYLGTDCSSDSLTVGNLAVYMVARQLIDHGWKAIMLVGGATSLVGDPGGKESERELKSKEEIEHNVQSVAKQVEQIVGKGHFTYVNNIDWFKSINYLDFLRDVGKHYSMTELLQRDFVSTRIGEGGSGISYAEFSYSLIQGYDYWHLFKKYGVELQIGGSDQWGNMLSGVPLIRKKENKEVHALSTPLIVNKSTGKKFGKSEDGAIWLDSKKTSVYSFYQFWLNIDDDSAKEYLKIYSDITKNEYDDLLHEFSKNPGQRIIQKRLAYDVTKLIHGINQVKSTMLATNILFGETPVTSMTKESLEILQQELPLVKIKKQSTYIDVLEQAGIASSKSEARRLLDQNAISANNEKINVHSSVKDIKPVLGSYQIVKRGKNMFTVLEIIE